MKDFREKLKVRVISTLGWALIHFICGTCRTKTVGYERVQQLMKSGNGFIMAVWHGRTMLPVHYCRGLGIWAITSLSRDGEIQTRIVSRFGYQIIRGSSGRGGMKAALIACKKLQDGGILSITPDGPTGPPNEVQDGILFLAERANCPIIPLGVGANPRKTARAWDSYLIPSPFCRAAIYFGEPINLSELAANNRDPKAEIKSALDECQRKAQEIVGEGC